MKDNVNSPSHYTAGRVECIEAIESATCNLSGLDAVCTANVIKYVWRWKQKNGLEDLKKARWYLNRMIAQIEVETPPIVQPSFLDAYDQIEAVHMSGFDRG